MTSTIHQDIGDILRDNMALVIAITACYLVVTIIMALVSAKDARQRGDRYVTWLFVILLTGPVGFCTYLARRAGKLQALVHAGVVVARITTGTALLLVLALHLVFPSITAGQGIVSLYEIWPDLGAAIAIASIFGIVAWAGASNRIGTLASFLGAALAIWATWDLVFRAEDWGLVPDLTIVKWVLFGIIVAGGFTALFTSFGAWFTPVNSFKARGRYIARLRAKAVEHKKALAVALPVVAGMLVMGIASQSPLFYTGTITIQPGDYQASISFWGNYNYNMYNDSVKVELDRHHATIVFYNTPDIRNAAQRNAFVNQMITWRDNYPNVKFIAAIPGITRINTTGDDNVDFLWGGFAGDWAVEGTVKFAKEFILLAQAENLTNFVGINTDQESPDETLTTVHGVDTTPNKTRHDEGVALYDEFFQWVRDNAPGFVMSSTMGNEPFVDMFDGDLDMHYKTRWHVFDVDSWDEIAPMIYRCGYKGEKPFGGFASVTAGKEISGRIEVYNKLRFLNASLHHYYGDSSKLGIYLGITNCTCYGRDVDQYDEYGTYLGKGYDELVADALIAKHFGAPNITLFILDTVVENGYSMGGVFDTWGLGFLDAFNASINGPNATTPFAVNNIPKFGFLKDVYKDLVLNLGTPAGLVVIIAIVVANAAAAIACHPRVKRAIAGARGRR